MFLIIWFRVNVIGDSNVLVEVSGLCSCYVGGLH